MKIYRETIIGNPRRVGLFGYGQGLGVRVCRVYTQALKGFLSGNSV